MERHDDDGCVIDVGVIVVPVLERPSPGAKMAAVGLPVSLDVEDLPAQQPFIGSRHDRIVGGKARFHHRMGGQAGVPYGRQTRLAIAPVVVEHQKPVDGLAANDVIRMILGNFHRIEGHQRVGHGRENSAQAILAVEALGDEFHRPFDGHLFQTLRNQRDNESCHKVDNQHQHAKEIAGRVCLIKHLFVRRFDEQFGNIDAAWVAGLGFQRRQHLQRHHYRSRPIGNPADVERRPFGQQHGFNPDHRDGAPRHLAEQGQGKTGEDV